MCVVETSRNEAIERAEKGPHMKLMSDNIVEEAAPTTAKLDLYA